jgi:hypothetical protein
MELSGHFNSSAALPLGKLPIPQYLLDRRLDDQRIGLNDVDRRKILPVPGLELRPVGRPVTISTTNIKWILKSKVGLVWTVFIRLKIGQRRSLVNTIIGIRVSWKAGNFIASSQGLCSVELVNSRSVHIPVGWFSRGDLLK